MLVYASDVYAGVFMEHSQISPGTFSTFIGFPWETPPFARKFSNFTRIPSTIKAMCLWGTGWGVVSLNHGACGGDGGGGGGGSGEVSISSVILTNSADVWFFDANIFQMIETATNFPTYYLAFSEGEHCHVWTFGIPTLHLYFNISTTTFCCFSGWTWSHTNIGPRLVTPQA